MCTHEWLCVGHTCHGAFVEISTTFGSFFFFFFFFFQALNSGLQAWWPVPSLHEPPQWSQMYNFVMRQRVTLNFWFFFLNSVYSFPLDRISCILGWPKLANDDLEHVFSPPPLLQALRLHRPVPSCPIDAVPETEARALSMLISKYSTNRTIA